MSLQTQIAQGNVPEWKTDVPENGLPRIGEALPLICARNWYPDDPSQVTPKPEAKTELDAKLSKEASLGD